MAQGPVNTVFPRVLPLMRVRQQHDGGDGVSLAAVFEDVGGLVQRVAGAGVLRLLLPLRGGAHRQLVHDLPRRQLPLHRHPLQRHQPLGSAGEGHD